MLEMKSQNQWMIAFDRNTGRVADGGEGEKIGSQAATKGFGDRSMIEGHLQCTHPAIPTNTKSRATANQIFAGVEGPPVPKQPQSTGSPLANPESSAARKITLNPPKAKLPTASPRRVNTSRPTRTSKGGNPSATTLIHVSGNN